MIDLGSFVENFIQKPPKSFANDNARDKRVLEFVADRNIERPKRESEVKSWLHYYKAMMFFPSASSSDIVREIIGFADELHPNAPLDCADAIMAEFERLKGRIASAAPPNRRSKKPRGITVLTSKALWCCYPSSIPIYDNNACSALQVIARLREFKIGPADSDYAKFVDAWLKLYKELDAFIDQANPAVWPFKVRILDKLLWHLGQNKFAAADVDA